MAAKVGPSVPTRASHPIAPAAGAVRLPVAPVPGPFARLHLAAIALWERAKHEHSSPRELGWSVGVGAFVACTPLLGLHLWLALGLATLLRLNRLWTLIASRLSSTPVLLVTAFCEIETAHRLRTGRWVPLAPHEALRHGRELLVDWILGTVLVGGLVATCAGFLAYALARAHRDAMARTREPRLRPFSESPPSKPRLPSP
jgi:uncharacterized protein (DUF2062 family)